MRSLLLTLSILLWLAAPLAAEEVRIWKDDTGLFSIEASLEQIEGDTVRLKRTDDGRVITLPISRLSAEDQRFIADLATQNPFEGGAPAGSQNLVDRRTTPARPSGVDVQQPVLDFMSRAVGEIRAVNLSQARQAGGVMPSVWSAEPDPAPQREYPTDVVRLNFHMANTSAPINFFVSPTGTTVVAAMNVAAPVDMAAQQAATRARIEAQQAAARERMNAARGIATQPTPAPVPEPVDDGRRGRTRFFIADTVTGNTITHDTPLKLVPFGFSPNGKRLLIHQATWAFPAGGKQTLLHIAEESAGWDVVTTFEPFAQLKSADASSTSSNADVQFATWVNDEHVLVRSGNGTLILLNLDTGEAIWRMRIETSGNIGLSPGGKYCFLPVGDLTILYETMTGNPIGGVDNAKAQFRFSPDGKRFVTSSTQGIILGDATTGEVGVPFFVPGSSNLQHVVWLDNRFLLSGSGTNNTIVVNGNVVGSGSAGANVIDTTSKSVVWTYDGLGSNIKLAGGYAWCLFNRGSREGSYLTPLTLPHAGMILPGISEESEAALLLKSGANVSLVLDDSIDKERADIREAMEKKIADNGWVLADAAPVTITLSMKEEKETSAEYGVSRSIGPPGIPRPTMPFRSPLDGPGIEVKFQPERYDLKITEREGGKELWSATMTTKPPSQLPLNVVQDDSLQEVIDKAMDAQSYKEWIEKVFIPRTISRPLAGKGTSRVTENGIVEVMSR